MKERGGFGSGVRVPRKVALIYALAAGGWILFSDRLLGALVQDAALLNRIQTWKGGFFVLVTALLLFALVRHYFGALTRSEEKFRILFENSSRFVGILSPEGRLLNANKSACGFIGGSEQEYAGKFFWDTPWWNDSEEHRRQIREVVKRAAGGERVCLETFHRGGDGQVRRFDFSLTPVLGADKKVCCLIPEGHDVTDYREAEALYRDFVEGTDDLITRVDRQGRILFVNHRAREIFGLEPSECLGLNALEFVHPEDREQTRESFAGWVRDRVHSASIENRQVGRDGKLHHLLWTVNIHFNRRGEVEAVNSIARDIGDRKEAERNLQAREALFRQTFDSAAIGMALVGVEKGSRFTRVNQALVRMLGFSEEELLGMGIADITLPEDREETLWMRNKLLAGEFENDAYHLEKRYLHKDGHGIWAIVSVALIRDASGAPVHLIGEIQDISDRKASEQAMARALARAEEARGHLDAMLRSIFDPLVVTDMEGRLILMNRAGEEALGVRADDFVQKPLEAISGANELYLHQVAVAASEDLLLSRDLQLFDRRKGEFADFQARSSVVVGQGGRESGVLTILQDVTRERRIDRMKTEFVSTAAHELRTPLTAMIGFSELLLELPELSEEARREYLIHVLDRGWALTRIVDDLLDVSRIEAGGSLPLHLEDCELRGVIRDLIFELQSTTEHHRFRLDLPQIPMRGDRRKLEQLFENILSNAVKYSPRGGLVEVEGELRAGRAFIRIRDEGMGMSPEQVTRVFEKFYRADASNTAIGGTGLGMSIVRLVAQAHGGQVEVESLPGKGTCVRVELPLSEEARPGH